MFRLEYVKSPPEPLPRAVCAVCAVCGVGVYFPSLFLYVCLCVYDLHAQGNRRDAKLTTHTEILQGEHVLFGAVKWKLDARLRYLMYV